MSFRRILKAESINDNEPWKCTWHCNFVDLEELPTSNKENIILLVDNTA